MTSDGEVDDRALVAAWADAQGRLPAGWTLDGLRCASTGLGIDQRSDDWIARAIGPDDQVREHRAADAITALVGLAASFEPR